MQLTIRLVRASDGRWIGDVPELPGLTVYGATQDQATLKAKALALRVIAEEIEHGDMELADAVQFSIVGSAAYSRLRGLRGRISFSRTSSELKVDR